MHTHTHRRNKETDTWQHNAAEQRRERGEEKEREKGGGSCVGWQIGPGIKHHSATATPAATPAATATPATITCRHSFIRTTTSTLICSFGQPNKESRLGSGQQSEESRSATASRRPTRLSNGRRRHKREMRRERASFGRRRLSSLLFGSPN